MFLQLTMGLTGCPGLCILMSPLMVGADGFMLVYFHLESCGIRVFLCVLLYKRR